MPMHALGMGDGMVDFTEDGMVGSTVAVLATVISSRTTGLGMSTASIPVFMGGSSTTCPPYGLLPHPTLAWSRLPQLPLCGITARTQRAIIPRCPHAQCPGYR
jgi:hypothetical protein